VNVCSPSEHFVFAIDSDKSLLEFSNGLRKFFFCHRLLLPFLRFQRRNPRAQGFGQSSGRGAEAKYLTAPEVRSILDNAQNLRYRTALQLIAGTGLRRGETLALRWEDVDLGSRVLHVRATLARTNLGLNITPPKTESALRQIALTDSLVEVLKFHRIAQDQEKVSGGNLVIDTGFVFATETGEPVDPRNLFRALVIASKKAGIAGVGLHTLRHSAATMMLEAGVPIHVVSRVLGHSGINITVDIYGHVSDEASRSAMEMLGRTVDGV
jgi:integrase